MQRQHSGPGRKRYLAITAWPFLLAGLSAPAHPQVSTNPPPPIEIRASPGGAGISLRPLDVSDDHYARVDLSLSTADQKVVLRWRAKASATASAKVDYHDEAVSFFPTALCRSLDATDSIYVAGQGVAGPVLERWKIRPPILGQSPGTPSKTTIQLRSVVRVQLPIDPSIEEISSIAAHRWPPNSQGKEKLWVFEWLSKQVFSIDPSTGAKTLAVPNTSITPYRTLNLRRHSTYGAVCIFTRKPFYLESTAWLIRQSQDPTFDPDVYVVYDSNLDGTIDGSMVIPTATLTTHPLYATGQFLE